MSAQVLQAQQMLKGTINDGIGTVTVASTDLNSVASLPSLGSDSVSVNIGWFGDFDVVLINNTLDSVLHDK